MTPYAKGRRYEEEFVRILRSILQLRVERSPLSKRWGDTAADVVIFTDVGEIPISIKWGSKVPNWVYKRSFFSSGDLVVGPVESLVADVPFHIIKVDGRIPDIISETIRNGMLFAGRRPRREWRIVARSGTLPLKEV